MNRLKPTLESKDYANLVTVLAVILAVEYSGGSSDIWDLFIGIVTVFVGFSFLAEARKHMDGWFSFLTSALICLGLVTICSAIYFSIVCWFFLEYCKQLSPLEDFARFVVFLALTFCFKALFINVPRKKSR